MQWSGEELSLGLKVTFRAAQPLKSLAEGSVWKAAGASEESRGAAAGGEEDILEMCLHGWRPASSQGEEEDFNHHQSVFFSKPELKLPQNFATLRSVFFPPKKH